MSPSLALNPLFIVILSQASMFSPPTPPLAGRSTSTNIPYSCNIEFYIMGRYPLYPFSSRHVILESGYQ